MEVQEQSNAHCEVVWPDELLDEVRTRANVARLDKSLLDQALTMADEYSRSLTKCHRMGHMLVMLVKQFHQSRDEDQAALKLARLEAQKAKEFCSEFEVKLGALTKQKAQLEDEKEKLAQEKDKEREEKEKFAQELVAVEVLSRLSLTPSLALLPSLQEEVSNTLMTSGGAEQGPALSCTAGKKPTTKEVGVGWANERSELVLKLAALMKEKDQLEQEKEKLEDELEKQKSIAHDAQALLIIRKIEQMEKVGTLARELVTAKSQSEKDDALWRYTLSTLINLCKTTEY